MTKETITINKEDWKRMYTIQCQMEQYFSYKNDNREVIAEMAAILSNVNNIKSLTKLQSYLCNSLLKFEGLGLI